MHLVHPHGLRECPGCGRGIALNRDGRFRRHFALEVEPRRLCRASLTQPAGVTQLLRVEPTAAARYSHAERLMRL